MSDPRAIVWAAVEPAARRLGFRLARRADAWLTRDETVGVLNLQRSSFGAQFYFNCGIWLTRLGAEARPREHRCHIRWRVSGLLPEPRRSGFERACDMDRPADEPARRAIIAEAVDSCGLALLQRAGTEAEARAMIDDLGPRHFLIHRDALPMRTAR